MSKTDKTTPYWVRLLRRDVPVQEVHDHENGPCDLPPKPEHREHVGYRGRGHCHWDYTYSDGVNHFCGCPMCTGKHERKAERRKRRHGKKRDVNERLED